MPVLKFRRGRILLVVIILLVVFYFIGHVVVYTKKSIDEMRCDLQESNRFVESVCHLYQKNNVTGNMCEHLCNSERIKTSECLNYRGGKLVLLSDCMDFCVQGQSIHGVLKSEYSKLIDIPGIPFSLPDLSSAESQYFQIEDMLEKFVSGTIKLNSGFVSKDDQSFVSKVWSDTDSLSLHGRSHNHAEITQLLAVVRSVWSLVSQNEYLFTKLHHPHVDFLPVIYGTCGPLYMQEYLPPGSALARSLSTFQIVNIPWLKRARIALRILDLLTVVEEKFHEPLHICDMKGENFGLDHRDNVKIIDSDNIFYESVLNSYLQDPNCTRHEQCDFFDCRGECDFQQNKCKRYRSNNNLQIVCEKIFTSRFSNLFNGLLYNPPDFVKYSLRKTLDLCAAPNGSNRARADKDLYNRIYSLLQQSIGL